MKRRILTLILALTIIPVTLVYAQESSMTKDSGSGLSLKTFALFQGQAEQQRVEKALGYGIGGQIAHTISRRFDLNVRIEYDHLGLTQADVLDEWDWHYWDSTYSAYLLGEIFTVIVHSGDTIRNRDSMKYYINHVRHAESSDGRYTADFDPRQSMKELMISVGCDYKHGISDRLTVYAGCNIGISKYFRRLEMHEHWIKRFDLDSAITGLDYEYKLDLLHYAPTKKGTKLFVAPTLGWQWQLTPTVDIDLSGRYYHYLDGTVNRIDQALGITPDSHRFFPFGSKYHLQAALVFRY